MSRSSPLYGEDLAYVHIEGYGFHVHGAAEPVLAMLGDRGIETGTVVDLGCGGGEWLQRLVAAGYTAIGVDSSLHMIKAAKQHVTEAKLIHGSFAQHALPKCDAVTSLGEPLNYLNSAKSIQGTMANVFRALRPGGIFIFDVRHPARGPVRPVQHCRVGDTWACLSRIEEDHRSNSLVRYITTFRKVGKHYRRAEEIHRLKIYSKADVTRWLRKAGFRVKTLKGYGDYQLSDRQSVFVATK